MDYPLTQALVSLLTPTFVSLGLSASEVLTGRITHTDLVWQAPPLDCSAKVKGIALREYLLPQVKVKDQEVFDTWMKKTLHRLRHRPAEVFDKQGYRGIKRAITAEHGAKRLMFSVPEGYPHCGSYTAAVFCLEAAEVLKSASHIQEIVATEDDYYVVTDEGLVVGIHDGKPTHGFEDYDVPLHGIVTDLRLMPRGQVFQGCDYDLIAKCRSVIHDHKEKVKDFEAMDTILQALRVIAGGAQIPALQTGIARMRHAEQRSRLNLEVFTQCCELWSLVAYGDSTKLKGIEALLVPDVLTLGEFKAQVFRSTSKTPKTLHRSACARIARNLNALKEQEERYFAN
jgi:hypothetical protein